MKYLNFGTKIERSDAYLFKFVKQNQKIMKTILYFVTAMFFTQMSFAQKTSNLIIFAEDATPFYAIVNGIKQNTEPQTNVKITGLTNPANQIKVIFKDPNMPALDKQIYFEEMNVEATMKITNTKKGYKLRYFGEVSMGSAVADPNQNIISYHTVEPSVSAPHNPVTTTTSTTQPVTTTVVVEEIKTVVNNNPNNTQMNTTVNTNTTGTTGGKESVNLNVNVGGVGFNMDVNINDGFGEVNSAMNSTMTTTNTNALNDINYNQSTTITTTTTTSTTGGIIDNTMHNEPVQSEPIYYVDGYSGSVGCAIPSQNFSSIMSAINDESFSEDKMNVAKQATKNKCLTTDQVIEICNLFSFEDSKLDFAKYAYPRTYDIDNYYKVNSVFGFSSSKKELNDFINK
jgi:hypothetical protein